MKEFKKVVKISKDITNFLKNKKDFKKI